MSSRESKSYTIAIFLSILLLTLGISSTDSVFAHHKEGHDNGGGNDNGKKKNKDKKDNKTDKEKYGEKSKNNLLKKPQEKENEVKNRRKKNEVINFIKPNKNNDKKINSKISELIKSKDAKKFAKENGFDYYNGNTRLMRPCKNHANFDPIVTNSN